MGYNMVYNNVMIDIETLSVAHNACICTIAAVKFDINDDNSYKGFVNPENIFYVKVDIETCKAAGLDIDPNTVKWWNSQPEETKSEIFGTTDRIPLKLALIKLSKWITNPLFDMKVWCHGASFDCVILQNAFDIYRMSTPWKFWNIRDTRTLYDIANIDLNEIKKETSFASHHALSDCYNQIIGVNKAVKKLSNNMV